MTPARQPAMTTRSPRAAEGREEEPLPRTRGSDPGELVSVIIPCYNQAHFLADALQSVGAPEFARKEIIVVDDGSEDDTPAVASAFPSVRYVWQQNRGLAGARNTGLAQASGDLLVFLDADDRLLPGALQTGARLLRENPHWAFVAGRSRFISPAGLPLPTGQPSRGCGDPYLALLRRNSIRNPAMVMFRRSVLERVGGFDPRVHACADYEMYLRISREFPVGFHNAVVADYRKHDANMSGDAALMMRQLQRVIRAQRPYLTTRSRQQAYRDGMRNVRAYYGDKIASQIRSRVRTRSGWLRTLSDAATLIWCHPAGAVEHVTRKVRIWRRGGIAESC